MRAKPSSNTRSAARSHRPNGKTHVGNPKGMVKKSKEAEKKVIPDLSILRQPVDTSINGLKQAVKVFETGTPEVLHLLTYDCDVVYECKICRNLFRSIANFISHKRIYCTKRYSRSQELRSSKEGGEDYTLILDKAPERLPSRITARKDLTSIVESLTGPNGATQLCSSPEGKVSPRNSDKKPTTVHLEPMENTTYGVFQTVLKPDSNELMKNQVTELQNLISQNEVILGPDGRILENGVAYLPEEEKEDEPSNNDGNICAICNTKFANRKTLAKHKKLMHDAVRTSYSCPCCKNYFANPWSVYRHLYKVHRKTNEQVRRLRSQIHKKDIKVDKTNTNIAANKKVVSPSKKKVGSEVQHKMQQDNKEWMDHFEDNWELQRCGGCGRKFERKAALISHSQICQKRIAACNKIEHKQVSQPVATTAPIVVLSPLPCSKKPIPKPSPEKKIGIQVRMNYCKNSSSPSQVKTRSVLGDESDVEAMSVDGKDSFFHHGSLKNSLDMKGSSVIEEFLKNANKCSAEGVSKVESYLNSTSNTLDKVHTYEISTCKRSTIVKSNIGKSKSLEAKCLQLRSALENGLTDAVRIDHKQKEIGRSYLDGNVDDMSESNSSAISSLSSQLTPLGDKRYVCEVEQSIEIKNINISRTLEKIPSTEADSTSMSNTGGLQMTYNSHTYKGNIKFSPTLDATCEEVSTSVNTDETPREDCRIAVHSTYSNNDEPSIDVKPTFLTREPKHSFHESELENTISILTRNQLKAICKDDLPTNRTEDKKVPIIIGPRRNVTDAEVEATTRDMIKKKLHRYADENTNTCSICHRKFKKVKDIYKHIPSHTRWRRYECLYNGCTFQTFMKKACLHHVTLHTMEGGGETAEALVGLINPSRWNLKLVENIPQPKALKRVTNGVHKKNESSKKLVKATVNIAKKSLRPTLAQKIKLQAKMDQSNGKIKITKLLNESGCKQKLLTEFTNFNKLNSKKLEGGSVSETKKILTRNSEQNKALVNGSSPKRLKTNTVVENGKPTNVPQRHSPPGRSGRKLRTSNPDDLSRSKLSLDSKEIKKDEIVVNHLTEENSEPSSVRGRGSRASSRKSSVNSVDQQKGKNPNNVVKTEESSVHPLASATTNESTNSFIIQNTEIVDASSSLEEEESQESDRTVDDSHLKKIFMEVIFGPTPPAPIKAPGRPVRNKSRPKRDSDFFLGDEKEISEGKSSANKRTKTPTDAKQVQEIYRKTK